MVGETDVLDFWFGALDEQGRSAPAYSARWWRKDPAFDELIGERFGALHAAIERGAHEDWLQRPRGTLAYILVLDQFSRNLFRGSPRMFDSDERAREVALAGMERGQDRQVAFSERGFFYLPLMHSEELADQERCIAAFTAFEREVNGALQEDVQNSLKFAWQHHDIVRRFGRFPHRNGVLGRTSTAEEIEFLQQPGSSF